MEIVWTMSMLPMINEPPVQCNILSISPGIRPKRLSKKSSKSQTEVKKHSALFDGT
jgi:hypothetical protein